MTDRYSNRNRNRRDRGEWGYERDHFNDRQQEQFAGESDWNRQGYGEEQRQMEDQRYAGSYQPDNNSDFGYDANERFSRPGSGYVGSQRAYRSTGEHNYGPARVTNQRRDFRSFTSEDQGGSDFVAGDRRPYGGYGPGMGGESARYASGRYDSEPHRGYTNQHRDRGFFDRAGDEVASWFGDEDAARRREMDHSGRGPRDYNRSDERILEDACDNLTKDWGVDARNIQVTVDNSEVTLDGTVDSRRAKRRAEDCVDCITGVRHVQNNLRVDEMTGNNRAETESTGNTMS